MTIDFSLNGKIIDAFEFDLVPSLSTITLGHTVELEGVVYEVIGVRHVILFPHRDSSRLTVYLDEVGPSSTMPPPPEGAPV